MSHGMIRVQWEGKLHPSPMDYARFCLDNAVPVVLKFPVPLPEGAVITYAPKHQFVAKILRAVPDVELDGLVRRLGYPPNDLPFAYEIEALD